MKKIITVFILLAITVPFVCRLETLVAKAAETSKVQREVVYLKNGDYMETIIINSPTYKPRISALSTSKTITKTKTFRYKNKKGTILWSLSIKATFIYNGSTSKCTACSHSATAPAKTWSIKSVSSSRSGNSATAKAIVTHSGNTSYNYAKSVTISCSKNGIVS